MSDSLCANKLVITGSASELNSFVSDSKSVEGEPLSGLYARTNDGIVGILSEYAWVDNSSEEVRSLMFTTSEPVPAKWLESISAEYPTLNFLVRVLDVANHKYATLVASRGEARYIEAYYDYEELQRIHANRNENDKILSWSDLRHVMNDEFSAEEYRAIFAFMQETELIPELANASEGTRGYPYP